MRRTRWPKAEKGFQELAAARADEQPMISFILKKTRDFLAKHQDGGLVRSAATGA